MQVLLEQVKEVLLRRGKIMIKVKNLGKKFTTHHLSKTVEAVRKISFEVEEGKFLGITGKSGSGKSTIIKCIYGTYLAESGELLYQSKLFGEIDLARALQRQMLQLRKKEIGYVSQFLSATPRTTAFEFVTSSLLEMGELQEKAEEKAAEALKQFGIAEKLWGHYPVTLSGGEKLRVNIAQAFVKQPSLLLLDEPTASLDDGSKAAVREAIIKLKQEGTTMIGIFHDLAFMDGVCDTVYQMTKTDEY